MESVSIITFFGLKMIVKSGLESFFISLHAGIFSLHSKPIPVMKTGFSLCTFPNREKPVSITWEPCNENRFFPVWEKYTGKTLYWPCTGPVMDCSVWHSCHFTVCLLIEERWNAMLFKIIKISDQIWLGLASVFLPTTESVANAAIECLAPMHFCAKWYIIRNRLWGPYYTTTLLLLLLLLPTFAEVLLNAFTHSLCRIPILP